MFPEYFFGKRERGPARMAAREGPLASPVPRLAPAIWSRFVLPEWIDEFRQGSRLHRSTPSVLHPQSRMILLGFEGRSCLSGHQLESSIFGILFECLEVGSAFGSIPETQFHLSNR